MYVVREDAKNGTLTTTGEGTYKLAECDQKTLKFLYEKCGVRDVILWNEPQPEEEPEVIEGTGKGKRKK